MSQEAALQEKAERLVRKLEEVRRNHAEQPEAERRAAFERTLDDELGSVPAADADRVIGDVRSRLIHTARERDQRVSQLEGRLREQETTIADLRRQLEEAAKAPAPAPAAAPVSAGPAPDLDVVRAALSKVVEGQAPNAAELGLSSSDESLYSLFAGLMQFTMGYGEGRTWILASLGVGAAAQADSVMIKGMQDKARQAMRQCLAGDTSAGKTLQEELNVYAKFLIALNESFQFSIDNGSRKILGELNLQPLLDKHKRLVGPDYEKAWRELELVHAGLSDLTRNDLWEQYFRESFREKLGGHGKLG